MGERYRPAALLFVQVAVRGFVCRHVRPTLCALLALTLVLAACESMPFDAMARQPTLGPARMVLGWLVDQNGHRRHFNVPSCLVDTISALDHLPNNFAYTNPFGWNMVSVPRSSATDRYYVSFYAFRDLYGTTLPHPSWQNQVHIHYFRPNDKVFHVAKLGLGEHFTAVTGIGPDIVFTVMAIGTDSAEVEIRRGNSPSCGTVKTAAPTPPPTQPPTASPTTIVRGDLSCGLGLTFTGSTVGARNRLGYPSGDAFFSLTVAENDTEIIIETCESDFDTVITVYRGSDVSAINPATDEVASVDNNAGQLECGFRVPDPDTKSWLVHTYQAGSYIVLVEGWGNWEGNYVLKTDAQCPAPTTAPTLSPAPDCPDGYYDDRLRFDAALGKITIVTTHEQCSARCTQYSGPQFAGGCKGYQTGMYFGMLFCRSYGRNWRSKPCATWAHQSNKGTYSGELGSIHPRSGQLNLGGSCCTNGSLALID